VYRDGQDIWHWHGFHQTLEPLRHVGQLRPAGSPSGHDVSRIHQFKPCSEWSDAHGLNELLLICQLPVWGGKSRLMGVSPIAAGAPGGPGGIPFVLDMAPSVAARG
jgi:hypothetical protein